MIVFCILWMPLFYLFRRSIHPETGTGAVWALILGSIVGLVQFFLGSFIEPGGFGLSRWLSALVDVVALPVLLPLLVYLFMVIFRVSSSNTIDFANFTLLWLIPCSWLRVVSWSAISDPVYLVLVPLLWAALATGVSFFVDLLLRYMRWFVIIPCALGILLMPLLATTSWWAFYMQDFPLGLLLLLAAGAPMLVSLVMEFVKARD